MYKLETQETQWYSSSSMSLKADKTNTQVEDSKAEKANSLVFVVVVVVVPQTFSELHEAHLD